MNEKFQQSRNDSILRLKQLRDITEAKGEEMDRERERFDRLRGDDAAPRVVSADNLFQTPPPVACDMIAKASGLLGDLTGMRILEPSAGLGRIYREVRRQYDCEITMVEQAAECCEELYRETENDAQAKLIQDDFLACGVDRLGLFDLIVANPPFRRGTDVKHIRHMKKFLKPGGAIVTLCFNGSAQNKHLEPIADHWEELPANAFKSEGTRAGVVLMTIES